MRPINEDDVLSIVDDLRDRMTVECYCAMVERVKALPSAQPETHEKRTEMHACDYERAVEQLEHDMLYEPTFNQDDGSM